ncbi:uncharacterized protein LOC133189351 [Saccostrea echinata]|uniref:uncharacterized protein LOC133189351 n=1 Tax=Saccostrea echinata TaxID=191078 RepID=UPI002A7FF94A|nr:uncharacterized protein LOC133189351 [Saccostrea echinata]
MESDDKQSKVTRYSGSTENQSIQFDDQGKLLYSSDGSDKHICENKNLDICVADCGAKAVVVVNQVGELKFRYDGHTPGPLDKVFNPKGIITDSQSNILTGDYNNCCVHILDKNGDFLRYIKFKFRPYRMCIDSDDNLFLAVAELNSSSPNTVQKVEFLR